MCERKRSAQETDQRCITMGLVWLNEKCGGNPARAPICLTHLADGDDKRWEAGLRRKDGLLEKFAKIGLISRERARLIEITEQPAFTTRLASWACSLPFLWCSVVTSRWPFTYPMFIYTSYCVTTVYYLLFMMIFKIGPIMLCCLKINLRRFTCTIYHIYQYITCMSYDVNAIYL